ncbi:MAG: SMC-Scp complex subunit ScpB, partial [Oscillibacter sp.]|nr:SMC-Scp complex subunit ScpB [Oscillibacter sp.]
MDEKELESAVEGILFASGEPLHIERICFALSIERADAERILRRLQDYYAFERRGMRLLQMENRWQLCSSPDHADAIRKAFEIRKPAKLSQPALEALTIIAYYQPTTRAYVDKLRGVDSAYTVGLLLERGLIETCGNLQAPGRPLLYRTTEKFLRSFHISSLDELPPLNEDDIPPQQLKIEDIAKADAPQPETVPEPGSTDEPEVLAEAESVDEPQAVAEPESADEPESTDEPETVPEPGSTDEPE